jgi:hypothetical protein
MKKVNPIGGMALAAVLSLSTAAFADGPQAMFGVSYTWGGSVGNGNLGISAKVISSREKNNVIAAGGVTYYPWAPVEKFGVDLSAGYLFEDFAVTGGWAFIQSDWIVSAGYVNTIEDDDDGGSVAPPPAQEDPAEGPEEEPADDEPESPGAGPA